MREKIRLIRPIRVVYWSAKDSVFIHSFILNLRSQVQKLFNIFNRKFKFNRALKKIKKKKVTLRLDARF